MASFNSVGFVEVVDLPTQGTPLISVMTSLPASQAFESDQTPYAPNDSLQYNTLFNVNDLGYSDYKSDVRYDTEDGLLLIAVAGPLGIPAEVIRVHAPYTTKSVQWTAERIGIPPTLPSSNTSNANELRARRTVIGASPPLHVEGLAHVYRFSGFYAYLMPVPKADTDQLSFGKVPSDSTAAVANSVGPANFDNTLLQSL